MMFTILPCRCGKVEIHQWISKMWIYATVASGDLCGSGCARKQHDLVRFDKLGELHKEEVSR